MSGKILIYKYVVHTHTLNNNKYLLSSYYLKNQNFKKKIKFFKRITLKLGLGY